MCRDIQSNASTVFFFFLNVHVWRAETSIGEGSGKKKSTTVEAVKEQRAKTEGREAGGDRVTREERLSVAWQQNIIRCDGVGGMKGKMGCDEE